jgi:hypothetical protein
MTVVNWCKVFKRRALRRILVSRQPSSPWQSRTSQLRANPRNSLSELLEVDVMRAFALVRNMLCCRYLYER